VDSRLHLNPLLIYLEKRATNKVVATVSRKPLRTGKPLKNHEVRSLSANADFFEVQRNMLLRSSEMSNSDFC